MNRFVKVALFLLIAKAAEGQATQVVDFKSLINMKKQGSQYNNILSNFQFNQGNYSPFSQSQTKKENLNLSGLKLGPFAIKQKKENPQYLKPLIPAPQSNDGSVLKTSYIDYNQKRPDLKAPNTIFLDKYMDKIGSQQQMNGPVHNSSSISPTLVSNQNLRLDLTKTSNQETTSRVYNSSAASSSNYGFNVKGKDPVGSGINFSYTNYGSANQDVFFS